MGMDAWIEECEKGCQNGSEIVYWRKFWNLNSLFKFYCKQDANAYSWKLTKKQVLDIFRNVETVQKHMYQICKDFIPKSVLNLPTNYRDGSSIIDFTPIAYIIMEFENYLKNEKVSEIPDSSYVSEHDIYDFLNNHITDEIYEKLDEIADDFYETQFGNPAGSDEWILDILKLKLDLEYLLKIWDDNYDYWYFVSW